MLKIHQTQPNYHYFAEDLTQAMSSLDTILARTSRTLYVGHGGPLAHQDVQRWRKRSQGNVMTTK